MSSLNKVMLIGRLGKDPEIRYTQSGSAVANFSVATSEGWTDKQGLRQEKTEWHDVVAWNKLADVVQNYLKRGSQVYVEGRLQSRSWDDAQSGQKRYKTEINAVTIQMLGARSPSGTSLDMPEQSADNGYPSVPAHTEMASASYSSSAQPSLADEQGGRYIEDDVPF